MHTIVITKIEDSGRGNNCASLENDPTISAVGKTSEEAVYRLINMYPDCFNIQIRYK